MTLRIYNDVEQGTDEWLELRRGIVTASVVGQLITAKTIKPAANTESRALTRTLVAERITGHVEESYVSDDMRFGHVVEPVVREMYADHYEPVAECGFMRLEALGWTLGYSPDGVVGKEGLIEIKSRRQKEQLAAILDDEVPAANMAQLQCGLLVSGRKWIDYLSFCSEMPLWRKRIEPDPRWQEAIVEAVVDFETAADDMIQRYRTAVEGLPVAKRVDFGMEVVI